MDIVSSDALGGYDRAITMFSPDGRLLQVEYARKTVSQGTTAIGITCKEGVVFIADKRIIDQLIVPESVEKVFKIDNHIGAVMSGLISDGRVLIERAQVNAQNHKVTFGEPIDVYSLTKDLCDYIQMFTQYGGARPFGVSLIIGGVDDKPHVFMTEPSGIFFEYKAVAMGENSKEVMKILEKKYKYDMTLNQAINLGISALKEVMKSKFSKERLDVAVISVKDKKFKKVDV